MVATASLRQGCPGEAERHSVQWATLKSGGGAPSTLSPPRRSGRLLCFSCYHICSAPTCVLRGSCGASVWKLGEWTVEQELETLQRAWLRRWPGWLASVPDDSLVGVRKGSGWIFKELWFLKGSAGSYQLGRWEEIITLQAKDWWCGGRGRGENSGRKSEARSWLHSEGPLAFQEHAKNLNWRRGGVERRDLGGKWKGNGVNLKISCPILSTWDAN